ncbi:O-methyltransferase [Paenibacillus albiflavus]|nr:O-methyltransferase [Paenibacillus albiflavus]
MMLLSPFSLARQVDLAFWELKDELCQIRSGTITIQVRDNVIGKFGVKHLPMESRDGRLEHHDEKGLSEAQFISLKSMAIDSLKYKKNWTHGEIAFDFTIRNNVLFASVQFESNYNMANLTKSKSV